MKTSALILLSSLFLFVSASAQVSGRYKLVDLEEATVMLDSPSAGSFESAARAIEDTAFVVAFDRIQFKKTNEFPVISEANFFYVDGDYAVIQVASNSLQGGFNNMGGITLEGTPGGIEKKTDRRGNAVWTLRIQGAFFSARVTVTLNAGTDYAEVTIVPDFGSWRLYGYGKVYPRSEVHTLKGRSSY